ncbi:hypothetical protein X797_003435 [Metarhizium robertsii]|uniref:Uncharacterized protein n=1 Tax=Metarhizium robertsii TaxID=568076 RepID=A0A0A1V1B9_9HYPO|nr:hypothetical protein X797_003435 [Metarhizium robertsii]
MSRRVQMSIVCEEQISTSETDSPPRGKFRALWLTSVKPGPDRGLWLACPTTAPMTESGDSRKIRRLIGRIMYEYDYWQNAQ